jgi:sulfur carrier protein
MPLSLTVNGQTRVFDDLSSPTPLNVVVEQMNLKADRVAVEHNGVIAPRSNWSNVPIHTGDRLEIVQFVGGGCPASPKCLRLGVEGSPQMVLNLI